MNNAQSLITGETPQELSDIDRLQDNALAPDPFVDRISMRNHFSSEFDMVKNGSWSKL